MDVGDTVWMAAAYLSGYDGRAVSNIQKVTLIDLGDSGRYFEPLIETVGGDRYRIGRIHSIHDTESEARYAAADKLDAEAARIASVAASLRAEAAALLATEEVAVT